MRPGEQGAGGQREGKSSASKGCWDEITCTERRSSFEARDFPLRGERGDIVGGAGIIRETTEREVAEERLLETESRFRTMADCAPVLLWMSGQNSECDFFNQTWLRFTGRTLDGELGVGWVKGVHPEDCQSCLGTSLGAVNARREFKMVYRLRRHDGEYRWILDNGLPRYTPSGTFAGFIGSCVDITDRYRADEERTILVAQLQDRFPPRRRARRWR